MVHSPWNRNTFYYGPWTMVYGQKKPMALTNETIQLRLTEKFGDGFFQFEDTYGMLTFEASKENNLKVLQFLFDDSELNFSFLTDLCAL
jgi:NADH-quinone oxidoreductase subunit C